MVFFFSMIRYRELDPIYHCFKYRNVFYLKKLSFYIQFSCAKPLTNEQNLGNNFTQMRQEKTVLNFLEFESKSETFGKFPKLLFF